MSYLTDTTAQFITAHIIARGAHASPHSLNSELTDGVIKEFARLAERVLDIGDAVEREVGARRHEQRKKDQEAYDAEQALLRAQAAEDAAKPELVEAAEKAATENAQLIIGHFIPQPAATPPPLVTYPEATSPGLPSFHDDMKGEGQS